MIMSDFTVCSSPLSTCFEVELMDSISIRPPHDTPSRPLTLL
jgi:hypothetical protein